MERNEVQIDVIPWIDLSHAIQERILQDMSSSFEKPVTDPLRFFRPSCRVWLYRASSVPFSSSSPISYHAVAITFRLGGEEYLDKFFVPSKGKGIGRRFFSEWATQLHGVPVRWRTDPILAEHFYGKHPAVWTITRHGDYIYQGLGRVSLYLEDILEWQRLPSAFSAQQGLNYSTIGEIAHPRKS